MSYNNPTPKQIRDNSKGANKEKFDKEWLNICAYVLLRENNRRINLEDAQALMNIFLELYPKHCEKVKKSKKERHYKAQFYGFCVPIKVDVDQAVNSFLANYSEKYPFTYILENDM